MALDYQSVFYVFVALALGGILKGATGAGTPVIAVPVLTMIYGVKFAIVIMLMPNLLTNIGQAWMHRERQPSKFLVWSFAVAGCVGVLIGTAMLVSVSQLTLTLFVAATIFGYVGLRLGKPDWKLEMALAKMISVPTGVAAGFLQGATGLSAPVSITFFNALRLDRLGFIASISVYFSLTTFPQIVALWYLDLLTWANLALSFAAFLFVLLFMPVGAMLARKLSRDAFDRATLVMLVLIAFKLVWDAYQLAVAA